MKASERFEHVKRERKGEWKNEKKSGGEVKGQIEERKSPGGPFDPPPPPSPGILEPVHSRA
jgi:hypothetical protein